MEINIGDRFGRLTIESLHRKFIGHPRKPTVQAAMVKCDCGSIKEVVLYNLKSGNTTSCGCYHREQVIAAISKYPNRNQHNTLVPWQTHGQSKTKLYRKWKAMIRRCESTEAHNYKWYGAKGIKVCPEWRNDFMTFYEWAHNTGYTEGLTIERKDSNGNYCPENCEWLTQSENTKQMRRSQGLPSKITVSYDIEDKVTQLAQLRDISPGEIIMLAVEKYAEEVMPHGH